MGLLRELVECDRPSSLDLRRLPEGVAFFDVDELLFFLPGQENLLALCRDRLFRCCNVGQELALTNLETLNPGSSHLENRVIHRGGTRHRTLLLERLRAHAPRLLQALPKPTQKRILRGELRSPELPETRAQACDPRQSERHDHPPSASDRRA